MLNQPGQRLPTCHQGRKHLANKVYRMCFNFFGVYILRIYNFRGFRIFKFVVAGYSSVEIFIDIQSEFLYYNSIQQLQRCEVCWTCCWIRLKMSLYRMKNCIRGFHIYWEVWTSFIGERLVCACKRSNREDPFAVAMKRGTETVGLVLRTILCICMLYMFAGSKNNGSGARN